jgi:predicted GH43/DUF377 family glycosyl hydrolase
MAWLTGWSYRKSITLSRAASAVTDYQMKLLVGESAGATGEDVDCNSYCQTDFGDLRFTNSDGTTPLSHWIESITGTTPNQLATIWIKFDSIGTGATTFYMYYGNAGRVAVYYNGQNGDGAVKIGLAYGDGIDYGFTKYPSNPILIGGPGNVDLASVADPFSIKIGSTVYLYYSGYSNTNVWGICLATSSDGISSWTKSGSNPILEKGSGGQWDDGGVLSPVVFDTGVVGAKRYRMLYTGFSGTTYQTGYAYSSDGIAWSKGGANPVISVGGVGAWDHIQTGFCSNVILIGSTYYVYYGGHDGTRYQVGLVTFTDFEGTYTKSGSNPVIAARTSAKQTLTVQTNSGTKTVTVADTGVFQTHEPVFLYTGAGWEFNYVNSITDGTHLELLNNAVRNYPETTSNIRSWMYGSITPSQVGKSGSSWKHWSTCFQALAEYSIQIETSGYHTSSDGTTWANDYANSPPLSFAPSVATWDQISAENMRLPDFLVSPPRISLSDGASTFLFFDHFLGTSLGVQWNSQGTPTVSGSECALDSASVTWDAIKAASYSILYNARVRVRFKMSDAQNHAVGLSNSAMSTTFYADEAVYFLGVAATPDQLYDISVHNATLTQTGHGNYTEGAYIIGEMLWKSGECKYYHDDSLISTYTTNIADATCAPRCDGCHASSKGTLTLDWFFVSQYLSPEPAWGSWGDEEKELFVTQTEQITAGEVAQESLTFLEITQAETIIESEVTDRGFSFYEVSLAETITGNEVSLSLFEGTLVISQVETITGKDVAQENFFYLGISQVENIIGSEIGQEKIPSCNLSLVIPLPTLSVTAIVDTFDLSLPIPLPQLSVVGLTGEMGILSFRTPFPIISVTGKPEVLWNIVLRIPFPALGMVGKTGELGNIAITFPFPTLAITELPLVIGNIHIISPFPFMDMYGDVIPVTIIRKAIVMHLFNYAVSHYVNYNFNSLAHFNKVFLGANEQGIYILDGNDDLGEKIEADITSGVRDLGGSGALTIPREAWLAYRSDGEMELDVEIDEYDDLPPIIYDKIAPAIMEMRGKMGRGTKARFFTWKLKNVDGSNFSLESLRILGDIIKRKTR